MIQILMKAMSGALIMLVAYLLFDVRVWNSFLRYFLSLSSGEPEWNVLCRRRVNIVHLD